MTAVSLTPQLPPPFTSTLAQIHAYIEATYTPGQRFNGADIPDPGGINSVYFGLSTLTRQGHLNRVAIGIYERPVPGSPAVPFRHASVRAEEHIRVVLPRGEPFTWQALSAFGARATVTLILSRLFVQGVILRTSPGTYMCPPDDPAALPRPATDVLPISEQVAEYIETHIAPGQQFTTDTFSHLRGQNVNHALKELIRYRLIVRLARGVYVRPLNVNDPEELERHARNVPPARWQRVLQHLETHVGPEEPFSPVILKTCGTSQKIQVSLKMLIRKGLIRKVSTGVYVRLVKIPEPVAGPAREHR